MARHVGKIAMPISGVTNRIEIRVTGLKGFAIRLRIAGWLLLLGARIAGVGIVIDGPES